MTLNTQALADAVNQSEHITRFIHRISKPFSWLKNDGSFEEHLGAVKDRSMLLDLLQEAYQAFNNQIKLDEAAYHEQDASLVPSFVQDRRAVVHAIERVRLTANKMLPESESIHPEHISTDQQYLAFKIPHVTLDMRGF